MQISSTAKTAVTLVTAVMMLGACSSANSSTSLSEDETEEGSGEVAAAGYDGSANVGSGESDGDGEAEREPFDEDAARKAAEEQLAAEPYNGSYGCTQDCSGHEAGWQWRAEHGYATHGNSNSFSEGGQAFDDAIESRVDEMRSDYDSGEEPQY